MHRFDVDHVAFARRMREKNLVVSISSGVKRPDYAVIDRLASDGVGADYVTIDIAHGHAETVHRMIEHIKTKLPQAFVIAGNVATPEAVIDLENWGADATKVGVGPGKVCITKLKTGFGTGGWQLSALKWCARVATKPIIADGGIRDHGDIAKSVRFGACMVMIGLAVRRPRGVARPHRRGRRQALQGVLRLGRRTSTRASTSTSRASASSSRSRAASPRRCAR
jgi:GMP reductase